MSFIRLIEMKYKILLLMQLEEPLLQNVNGKYLYRDTRAITGLYAEFVSNPSPFIQITNFLCRVLLAGELTKLFQKVGTFNKRVLWSSMMMLYHDDHLDASRFL